MSQYNFPDERTLGQKRVAAIVPIREGSKGLKNKNMRLFMGLPLYIHAVRQGLVVADEVFVTTDIRSIAADQLPEGCHLVERSAELATDDASMADVILDLIKQRNLYSYTLLLLQATSPLRLVKDISAALSLYYSGDFNMVMSTVRVPSSRLKSGFILGNQFTPLSLPEHCFMNRQELPPIYAPNGAVYVINASCMASNKGFPQFNIGATVMPESRSLDIDSEEDFLAAEDAAKLQASTSSDKQS